MDTQPDNLMFRAFADERRLRILHLLREQEMCVGDLVEVLDLPQSTVSRQLGILREAGLVGYREDGLWRHYVLVTPAGPLHEHLIESLGRCFAHVPELANDRARATEVRTSGGCCPAAGQALPTAVSTCSPTAPAEPPSAPK